MNRSKGWLVCGLLLPWLLLAACSGPAAQDASLPATASMLVGTDSSDSGAAATIPNTPTATPLSTQTATLEPTAQQGLTPEPTEVVESTTTPKPTSDTEDSPNESVPLLQYETRFWQGEVQIRGVGEGEEAWRVVEANQIPLTVDTGSLTPELAAKVDAQGWLAKLTIEDGTITEVVEQHLRLDRDTQQVLTDKQGNQIGYEVGTIDNRFWLEVNQQNGEVNLEYRPTKLDILTKDLGLSVKVYNEKNDRSSQFIEAVNTPDQLLRSVDGEWGIYTTPFTQQELLKIMAANAAVAAYRGVNQTGWDNSDMDITPIVNEYGDIMSGVNPGNDMREQIQYFSGEGAEKVLERALERGYLVIPDYEMYQTSDGSWRKRAILTTFVLSNLDHVNFEVMLGYERWDVKDLPPVIDGNTMVPDQIGGSMGFGSGTNSESRIIFYQRMPSSTGGITDMSSFFNGLEPKLFLESYLRIGFILGAYTERYNQSHLIDMSGELWNSLSDLDTNSMIANSLNSWMLSAVQLTGPGADN